MGGFMIIARTAAIFGLALALLPAAALGTDISIAFDPASTINIAEGVSSTVMVTFDETVTNPAPIVQYLDTTRFCSAQIDTVFHGQNRTIQISINILPGYFDSGNNYGIVFQAFDRNLDDTTATLHINVSNTPRSPVFLNLPDTLLVDEGQSDNYQIFSQDPDNNIRAYRFLPGSGLYWIALDSLSGMIHVVDAPDTIANWQNPLRYRSVAITVNDSTGRADTAAFVVGIQNVDRPPRFVNPSRDTVMSVIQGTQGTLVFRVIDPDSAEGDTPIIEDTDNIDTLTNRGWQISFNSRLLTFTPPLYFEGLASPVGFRFIASRQLGAPADTITINFYVIDNIPPGAINDFNADSSASPVGSIALSWTAPHEDGAFGGRVRYYQLRFSTSDPGANPDAWWAAANPVHGLIPEPSAPGSSETMRATALTEYQSYWFAVKSIDSTGNSSPAAFAGPRQSRRKPPVISLVGGAPEVVRQDSILIVNAVASDSGASLTQPAFDSLGHWVNATMDSTVNSSELFILKYFHFTQPIGTGDVTTISIQIGDGGSTTVYHHDVLIDRIRPNRPLIQAEPHDSLTIDNSFEFVGSKDSDAMIFRVLKIGVNQGAPIRITDPTDHDTDWSYNEVVYYQGSVTFKFYAVDPAGNISDTTMLNYWLVASQEPPNIIDPDSVDYHNSTVINPQSDSFFISFPYRYVSQFKISIIDRLGTQVYEQIDSLGPAPGEHQASWNGLMNRGPNAGSYAPDGRYLVRFSAQVYPVSPYDIPIEVELILDSYSPFEVSFFPQGGGEAQARIINNQTQFTIAVGDSGAVGIDNRAGIIPPYLLYGETHRIIFSRVDTSESLWSADLSSLPALPAGVYHMVLVIEDAAGNTSQYPKYFEVTESQGITGFVNYPNPFAPSAEETRIAYVLGQAATALTLEIYDSSGDIVFRRELDSPYLTAAAHEIVWDGKSLWGKMLNNGVYYARLSGDIETKFLKIAVVDR
jgi:hypothetical protein